MSKPNRISSRRLNGIFTRELVVDAAKELFTQKGYHNTSIYDIFSHSGISKGAFFHHWKTKEDLAKTILEEMRAEFEEHFFGVLKKPGRAKEKILFVMKTMEELKARSDWPYCRLLAILSTELSPHEEGLGGVVHQVRQEWTSFWLDLLNQARAEGDLREDLPANRLGFLMVSTLCGVNLLERLEGSPHGHETLDTLQRLIFKP